MKNKFLILTLLATTSLATNAWADDVNCYDYCTTAGNSCTDSGDGCRSKVVYKYSGGPETGTVYYSLAGHGTDKQALTVYGPTAEGSSASIPDYAFYFTSTFDELNIQGNITSIGTSAFEGAFGLKKVTIPNSVTSINEAAFYRDNSLTNVTIPDSITYIAGAAFRSSGLLSVNIPDSVTVIDSSAFGDCNNLRSAIVSDSVTSIGFNGFGQSKLLSIVIGENVTNIHPSMSLAYIPGTIFCPSLALCQNKGSTDDHIQTYTKHADGVYELTNPDGTGLGIFYASAEDMGKVTCTGTAIGTCSLTPNACASRAQCAVDAAAYKDAKAEQLAQNGVLCQTKAGCLKLMDMVSGVLKDEDGNTYVCGTSGAGNSIANCSAYAKANNIALNDPNPVNSGNSVGENGGSGGSSNGSGKRIYTIEEARQAVEAAGTETVNFRIRYK